MFIFFLFLIVLCNGYLTCDSNVCYCTDNEYIVQNLRPSANGCGGESQHIATPPDWEFERVCNEHDYCYSSCGFNKEYCDQDFGDGLVNQCLLNTHGVTREDCILVANTMYNAVTEFGYSYFVNAQEEHCSCE